MTAKYEEFRERIRANWNHEQTVAAWARWHPKIVHQLGSVNDALVQAARIACGMRVLDLASGSGEPAICIARTVTDEGHVVATDFSAGMLDLARQNANREQLTNVSFVQCDVEHLPFPEDSFDAVTCRMGVMFFVDLDRALGEILRVLRPGCRAAFAAWGPLEQNTLFAGMLQPFLKRIDVPEPPPGAPHALRFSKSGTLGAQLHACGFEDVIETSSVLSTPWPGTPEEAWEMFYEMAGPPFIDELPDAERAAAIGEAIANFRPLFNGTSIDASSAVVVASGTKPRSE